MDTSPPALFVMKVERFGPTDPRFEATEKAIGLLPRLLECGIVGYKMWLEECDSGHLLVTVMEKMDCDLYTLLIGDTGTPPLDRAFHEIELGGTCNVPFKI